MADAFEELQGMVGQESELRRCKDDVNKAMIRHWCEAMEDGNPLYTDEAYAKQSKYGGIIAPPQMVQAFSTPALWPKGEGKPDPFAAAVKKMGDAGYFGIVATTTTTIIAWVMTGQVWTALTIGFWEFLVKFFIYYLHERAWQLVPRGAIRGLVRSS